jgi:hypothetical protein
LQKKIFDRHPSFVISLITGLLIGITYSVSVLLKKSKNMTRKQIVAVCYFLMVVHAINEDTLLFAFFGADIFLLINIHLFFVSLIFIGIFSYYKSDPR